ncbi:MAG TPA: hypothetical protein VGJ60_07660 [Chloroflexota bacterium]|jgi:hypothetical protein
MQGIPTLARANGHAKQFDVLKLGDTVEERRPIEINGKTLFAWVTTNGRYPSSVAAELDDARNRWLSAREPINPNVAIPSTLWDAAETLADVVDQSDEPEAIVSAARGLAAVVRELQEEPELRSSEVEWQRYVTRALCALIPGLEEHEADLLSPQARVMVITELGYLRPPRAENAQDEGEGQAEEGSEGGGESQNPPEMGSIQSSIGAEPEPDSAATTE